MDEYNAYSDNNQGSSANDLFKMVTSLAQKFDGKDQTELLRAVYKEAEKGKRNGTLTNAQLDLFESVLSPALDDKKRKILRKIVGELKKI
jgi:hypothetical protein